MITTRFAPSPTGYLHIGGLRTALFNYLYARANGGRFLLRIEDTDMARNSQEATEAIIEAFKWVGLEHDGEVVYQSQRFPLYQEYIQKLLNSKQAYYCYMSKVELDALREEQRSRGETPRYDNRYRDFSGTPPEGVEPVVRIKAPLDGYIEFDDGVKGKISVHAKELDDFIIARSDGSPTYNFVVAIDDALMGVSDVIRGDDHLSNTPKQIIVYNALGFKIPKFYHVPMILNPQGRKLSKRDGAMGVMDYYKMGYLPEAILNFLVRLGWSSGDKEIFSLAEMLSLFSPNALNSSPSAYNQEKLLWLNAHYLKETPNPTLETLAKELLAKLDSEHLNENSLVWCELSESRREILYPELKDRSHTLLEFLSNLNDVLLPPKCYDEKMKSKLDENAKTWLSEILDVLERLDFNTPHSKQLLQSIDEALHSFAEQKGIKLGKLMPALRCAILGKSGGISVACAIATLGFNECKKRIEVFGALI